MNTYILFRLTKFANSLDSRGLKKEADVVDSILKKAQDKAGSAKGAMKTLIEQGSFPTSMDGVNTILKIFVENPGAFGASFSPVSLTSTSKWGQDTQKAWELFVKHVGRNDLALKWSANGPKLGHKGTPTGALEYLKKVFKASLGGSTDKAEMQGASGALGKSRYESLVKNWKAYTANPNDPNPKKIFENRNEYASSFKAAEEYARQNSLPTPWSKKETSKETGAQAKISSIPIRLDTSDPYEYFISSDKKSFTARHTSTGKTVGPYSANSFAAKGNNLSSKQILEKIIEKIPKAAAPVEKEVDSKTDAKGESQQKIYESLVAHWERYKANPSDVGSKKLFENRGEFAIVFRKADEYAKQNNLPTPWSEKKAPATKSTINVRNVQDKLTKMVKKEGKPFWGKKRQEKIKEWAISTLMKDNRDLSTNQAERVYARFLEFLKAGTS